MCGFINEIKKTSMCARKKASTSCRASVLYLAIMVMFKDMKIQVMI